MGDFKKDWLNLSLPELVHFLDFRKKKMIEEKIDAIYTSIMPVVAFVDYTVIEKQIEDLQKQLGYEIKDERKEEIEFLTSNLNKLLSKK